MRNPLRLLVGLVLLLLLQTVAFGTPPLTLSAHVDKNSMTVGDEIIYEVSVTHPSDVTVRFPGEEVDFSPFELKRYRPIPRHEEGGDITEGIHYFLTIFRLGVSKIPPVAISYTDYRKRTLPESSSESAESVGRGMGTRGSVETDPIEIRVVSVIGEETPSVVDIQRLKTEKENPLWSVSKKIGRILLVIGMACLVVYGIIRLLPKPQAYLRKEDPLQAAVRDLEKFRRKLEGQMPTVFHYEGLSKILRRYLADQFDPLSLHLTTGELRREMSGYSPCRVIAEKTHHILSIADLVKFANQQPSHGELDTFVKEAEDIIRYQEPAPAGETTTSRG